MPRSAALGHEVRTERKSPIRAEYRRYRGSPDVLGTCRSESRFVPFLFRPYRAIWCRRNGFNPGRRFVAAATPLCPGLNYYWAEILLDTPFPTKGAAYSPCGGRLTSDNGHELARPGNPVEQN